MKSCRQNKQSFPADPATSGAQQTQNVFAYYILTHCTVKLLNNFINKLLGIKVLGNEKSFPNDIVINMFHNVVVIN
jgi:hypothetical protein